MENPQKANFKGLSLADLEILNVRIEKEIAYTDGDEKELRLVQQQQIAHEREARHKKIFGDKHPTSPLEAAKLGEL